MAEARGGTGGEKGKKILSFASKKARRVQQKVQPVFIFHNYLIHIINLILVSCCLQ